MIKHSMFRQITFKLLLSLALLLAVSGAKAQTEITSLSQITNPAGNYKLSADISAVSGLNITFTGTLDGDYHTISGLSSALFSIIDGGTVKNVILDNVSISGDTNVGAICGVATGDARIYNCGVLATNSMVEKDEDGYDYISSCSSIVSGSGNVGGIVGLLDGTSRVINCFSYANVSGGSYSGGIVGYNNVATTANNLKTMVMNCIFYGEVSGSSIAPIYNGEIITNVGQNTGVSNFNYFRLESTYIQNTTITKVYNCALGAETRFLQRFEFFRHLLNSNRELAAWWATGSRDNKDEMLKWVMEPSQIGSSTPYPILKAPGKYPSVVNYDAENAPTTSERNEGGKLGELTVNIQMGSGAVYGPPTGASITTSHLTLNITDKDTKHFNFNYYKVQLPYYNDVGTNNYNGNRVVTGWKIVSITGGTPGSYTTGDDATIDADGNITTTPYNFADRNCTNKDLYSVSGRVFNQGAYWDVPEGVTAITIEPYWAKAAYLADAYANVVYNTDMSTAYNVPNVGGGAIYSDNTSYPIAGNNQVVRTTMTNAVTTLFNGVGESTSNGQTVYDYAIVLVGNTHSLAISSASTKRPFTIMSIDLDHDNEPDYSYILRFDSRKTAHPVRVDFLNIPGLGMAQKSTGGTGSYNFGIMQPLGWFESTNTSLFRVTQFEYDNNSRVAAPYIVQGGVIEQWVSGQNGGAANKTTYYHVGGNVWFKEFHRGTHQDKNLQSKHPPVSVTGGDYNEFYLTGLYTADVTSYADNAECYINGGRFGTVCGAAQEGIGKANGADNTGNIVWQIQNADIKEFYAGGLNAAKPVTGNLSTTITGSHVGIFCGGPKFGDMSNGKKVVTNATDCEFGTFFGAGYGGNSYSREAPRNHNNIVNFPHNDTGNPSAGNDASWNAWLQRFYKQEYNDTYGGVSTQFNYQFLPMSDNKTNVARIFVEYVKFSLATTRNVTSNLNNCHITGNFYGGGSLGKVAGDVTSTLASCTVNGSVFGSGYSASLPTVEVMDRGFETEPYYYTDLGTYRMGVFPATTTYTWQHGNAIGVDNTNHILYTPEDLTALGTVSGDVTLNITGNTLVEGKIFDEDGNVIGQTGGVFGGGDESKVTGTDKTVIVNINQTGGSATHYLNNVFGGGNKGDVASEVQVTIQGASYISNDVYGGGALANTGSTSVSLSGGTIMGDVYGGGLGQKTGFFGATSDVEALVNGNVLVELNKNTATDNCVVMGNIFGCNNRNGTPRGTVLVHIYKTAGNGTTNVRTDPDKLDSSTASDHKYELKTVYGGGNMAAYQPTSADGYSEVIVDGCDLSSIEYVYGGGNAASTPATKVTLNGAYEIGYVFGGGNGKDALPNGDQNPGANVGYLSDGTTEYGSGKTLVEIFGGTIHYAFGGSNTKGNIREGAIVKLDESGSCPLAIDEVYGAGNMAPQDGAAQIQLGCVSYLKEIYGGARAADLGGNIVLTITSGRFDRVFGGNNLDGDITGTITVNVEETGCHPIIIGQLYGGGNQAAYAAPAGKAGPTLNVRSFTSIGDIYGGGYGASAVVTGDVYVNIEECIGTNANSEISETAAYTNKNISIVVGEDGTGNPITETVFQPGHTAGAIGGINNVYGGGNEAAVNGNTHVNIGTKIGSDIIFVSPETATEAERTKTVMGVDIRGNVFGGGNNADVSGSTNVVVGKDI